MHHHAPQVPTHRITHHDGWKVTMYLTNEIIENLQSPDPILRKETRRLVCKRFFKACRALYTEFDYHRVSWSDIEVKSLTVRRRRD